MIRNLFLWGAVTLISACAINQVSIYTPDEKHLILDHQWCKMRSASLCRSWHIQDLPLVFLRAEGDGDQVYYWLEDDFQGKERLYRLLPVIVSSGGESMAPGRIDNLRGIFIDRIRGDLEVFGTTCRVARNSDEIDEVEPVFVVQFLGEIDAGDVTSPALDFNSVRLSKFIAETYEASPRCGFTRVLP